MADEEKKSTKEPKTVLDELRKSGAIKMGDDPSLVLKRLPLGLPALDELLGGGLPVGRCIESYGPESTGKTLLCQLAAAAVQKTNRPQVLYLDMERGYDKTWWDKSGVDTSKLLVSSPATAEKAIDVMVAMVHGSSELGIIILDSVAAMVPTPVADPEKSAEDNTQPGLVARAVSKMYYKLVDPCADNGVILLVTNQMRENIGGYDELQGLPGGRAQRHYNQIILRTRRDSWIKRDNKPVGFVMEITSKKNKTCSVVDGTSITLPFLALSQIDILTAYIEDGLKKGFIGKKGPYFYTQEQNFLGLDALRNFYVENPNEMEILKKSIGV